MIEWIHPGLILIIGSLAIPLFRGRAKKAYLIALPAIALIDCLLMSPGAHGIIRFLGNDLTFGRVDRLSLLFSYVFASTGIIGMIYALHVDDDAQHVAAAIYIGSALGVVFAGDFITLFIFWEIMAFSAVFLVWLSRTGESTAAGFRYLLVHIFGGICLLGGILMIISQTGSIAFDSMMFYEGGTAFYLILLGFIINAAVPPFGAWLPDAYPRATVTGAVFMTAFTTKSAVYVLIRGFQGAELLMWMGAIMAVYGVIYATIENNTRRLLSYHIISQVGYMVCGVGIGTDMALNGSASHAFAHIIYKGLLFMGAGAVIYMTGKSKLSELGGLYKTMPVTMVLFLIGGFSIAGAPLMSGFVSKSMIVTAAGENHNAFAFLMLTLASSGTFLSIVMKLSYYMFFGNDSGIRAKEPPMNMLAAMGIASFLCILIGCYPGMLYSLLPYPVHYHPYTAHHVISAIGIFGFTALGFFMFMNKLAPKPYMSIDTDWFYRKGSKTFMWLVNKPVAMFEYKVVGEAYEFIIQRFLLGISKLVSIFDSMALNRTVDGAGRTALSWSRLMQTMQNGVVHDYALIMAIGMVLAAAAFLIL